MGIAKNTGDALTFKILCEDGKTVIDRSVVRSALDAKHRNRRVKFDDEVEQELETLELVNPFSTSKDPSGKVKPEDEDDLVMTDQDIEDSGEMLPAELGPEPE